jgi:osmotically-inducible protein OsmY
MHKPNNFLEVDVRESFDWDSLHDDSRIVVKADDGRVTLPRAVETHNDVELASDDAWGVNGVREVDHELLVGFTGDAIADLDIQAGGVTAVDRDRVVPRGSTIPTMKGSL